MYEEEKKDQRRTLRDIGVFLLGAFAAAGIFAATRQHDSEAEYLRGKSDGFAQCNKPSRIEKVGKWLGE